MMYPLKSSYASPVEYLGYTWENVNMKISCNGNKRWGQCGQGKESFSCSPSYQIGAKAIKQKMCAYTASWRRKRTFKIL
jgi:hypothetical protein